MQVNALFLITDFKGKIICHFVTDTVDVVWLQDKRIF
jgi:hypothetical protein